MIFIGVISNYVNEIDQINDLFEELLNKTEESEKEIQKIRGLIVVNQLHASQPNDNIKDNIEDRSDPENGDANRADSYKIIKMEI